ncbi:putative isoprenylcysteine alpha-carbonyl methylesterase ICMEL1 [Glycine soja]|uniref:Putative isoprenylcysteine alpha-carbonyl methylesterase ICMEL1 n=1 Tax=Glycine soja TaxID=3848 RepID=A0A445GGK8_GLYSO|nr:putative isoprenylcysteine alpha-carbonyl methylesterase ICMEL1 [Glycine soja]
MPSQILPTPNYRALDSAVSSPPSMLLRAKVDDMDDDPSASLLQHSPPSFQEMSLNKPPLPRASSFTTTTATTTRSKGSHTRHCFYQKRRRRAASQDSLPSVSVDTASTTTTTTTTRSSFGRDVASETFLLTRLGFKMLRYLGVGYKWITKFLALGCYAVLLFPGFIQVGYYYFFSKQIRRSIVYGDKPRNRLDLYLPKNSNGPKPVVAFVTGGAWIIGISQFAINRACFLKNVKCIFALTKDYARSTLGYFNIQEVFERTQILGLKLNGQMLLETKNAHGHFQ